MPKNPVLLVLVLAALLAGLCGGFLSHAPNRLLAGTPIALASLLHGGRWLALLPVPALLAGPFLPQSRATQALVALAAGAFLVALLVLAGAEASRLAAGAPRVARTALGLGFWGLFWCAALALTDALRRCRLPPWARVLAGAALIAAILLLLLSGRLDQLAILREYAARRDIFAAAVQRHVMLVLLALLPVIALGLPLGIVAARRKAVQSPVFAFLNIVQTIPSIALFGLLIAPLAGLVRSFPRLGEIGIGGIGVAPAVIALILYLLLPVVRNTVEGLSGVPAETVEAARGLGMSARTILWQIELPLALPVLLSGMRVAVLQAIGLAAVAALIGAGGLGAIMFQGLFADALGLVLLGVLPMILFALAADALFRLGIAFVGSRPR